MAKKRKRRRPPSENHNRLEPPPEMPRKGIQFSPELWAVLDYLRGSLGYAAWLESHLRRTRKVKEAAAHLGIELPERNPQGRPRVRDYDNQRRTK